MNRTTIFAVFGSAIAGAATAVGFMHLRQPPPPVGVFVAPPKSTYGARSGEMSDGEVRYRLNAIEQKLGTLDNIDVSSHRSSGERSDANTPLERGEDTHPREISEHQRYLDHATAFRSDPVDPKWSRSAAVILRADLEGLQDKRSFQLVSTECHTTWCEAALSWKSRSDAIRDISQVVASAIKLNCDRHFFVPPTASESDSVQAVVHFDCTGLRATN